MKVSFLAPQNLLQALKRLSKELKSHNILWPIVTS